MSLSWAEILTAVGTIINIALLIWKGGAVSNQITELAESRKAHDAIIAAHKSEANKDHEHVLELIRAAQLDAAQKFVTVDNLSAFKQDITSTLNRLVDRVDRVLDTRGNSHVAGK